MLFFDFIRGIAVYRIETYNAEDFINAVKKKVSLKNLTLEKDGSLSASCFYGEREEFERLVHEKNAVIQKRRVRGLPVLAQRLLHRAGLVAGLLISVCLVMLSSLFVWEIRVEGNEKLSEQQVIEMLKEAGFCEGVMKKSVDVKKVTDKLLINEDEVSWMAINFDGTVAHVEMKEAKIAKRVPKKENVNLVASANGIILRVDALEGGTKVQKGQAVIKGELLVSAFVDKRTGGSMLRGARGFVWANTQRSFGVCVPLVYSDKKYTEKVKNEYEITFLGKTVEISNPLQKTPLKSEFTLHREKLRLFDKFVLPVTVKSKSRREYKEYTCRRTKNMALEIAKKTAKERLFAVSPDFVQLDFEEKYTIEDENLIYTCTFSGIENIAKELEFELS